ncbi:MAG TPA: DUF2314 domain-containing protein [Fimbriimonadaceae bacterium]|jgi:uncharacterized protein YegJ (DUF2314 family)
MKIVLPAIIVVTVILGFSLVLAHASCTQPSIKFVSTDLAQSEKDPAIYVAIKHAQNTLPEFIARYQNPKNGDIGFGVQTSFNTPQGPEHIWVHLKSYSDGVFTGRLAEEPNAIPGRHKGDTVTVKKNDVTDWIYQSDGQQVGGFTIEAIQKEGKR